VTVPALSTLGLSISPPIDPPIQFSGKVIISGKTTAK
jgi:hypothetical protein